MAMKQLLITLCIFLLSCEGPYFDIPDEPDGIAPVLTITYPPDNSVLSDSVLVTVFAHDNVGLEMVTVYLNDSVIIQQAEAPFEYDWATEGFSEEETHTIWAKASDAAGNTSQTQPIQVTVDNVDNIQPTGAIIFPYTGQTLSGDVTIFIEANDNDSLAYVNLYIDNDTVATMTERPFSYDWSTEELIDDITYTIYAHVVDGAGNQITLGPISVLVDNYEEEDTISPTGTITNPPSASTVMGDVLIQVSAYDNIEMGSVEFIIDGSSVFTDLEYPYEYTWNTLEALEDAHHVINVNLTDWTGNTTSLFPVSIFVNNQEEADITPPTIVLIEPAAAQVVSGTIDVTAIVTDNVGINRVEFYKNYTLDGTVTSSPYEHSWNTTSETEGSSVTWHAKVFDTSENSAQSQPISVTINNNDNTPPSGSITYPYAGQTLTELVQIQVSATDNDSVSTVQFLINGSVESTDDSPPFSYDWNTESVEDGQYILTAEISDFSNNSVITQSLAVNVNNDSLETADQIPPNVILLNPLSGQVVNEIVEISVSASDNDQVDVLSIFINSEEVATSTETSLTYNWSTIDYNNESEQSIWATAEDPTGNVGISQTILVTVNNVYEEQISDVVLEPFGEMIRLDWSSALNASSYKIYRDSVFISETSNIYFEDDVMGGVNYCYMVTPINSVGLEGYFSDEVCGKATLLPPETITYSVDTNSVLISWSSVTNAIGYAISRDETVIWHGPDLSYSDLNLDYATSYLYYIQSIESDSTFGEASSIESVTTHTQLTAPDLSVSISGITATLNWTSVETATSYRIIHNGNFHGEVTALTETIETNSGVESCFVVLAINEHGTEGPASALGCATGSFSAPELGLSVSGTTASLSWSSVESAETYRVYKDDSFLVEQTSLSLDDDIGTGTEVCFTVKAVNIFGTESPTSNQECGTGE